MALKTLPFDATEYLDTPEAQADFLKDAMSTGNAEYITHAIGIIARARGMTQVAKDAGITRAGLYKSLSAEGDPRLSTLLGVLKALGVRLSAEPADA